MKKLQDMAVLLIGLGQIGGSLGLDLVAGRLVSEVIGYDLDPVVREKAVRRRVIDRAVSSIDEGLPLVDLVILAVPLRGIISLLPVIAPEINDNTVIFDVGGAKTEILRRVAELGLEDKFLGGHPLAGNEGRGLAAASRDKFRETTFVLTPTDHTPPVLVARLEELICGLAAKPLVLPAAEHDRQIALTSNLPYLFSLALLRLAQNYAEHAPALGDLIGGSFRSATRVAASAPELIVDMFMTNPHNISGVVDELIAELTEITRLIVRGDEKSLRTLVTDVQKKAGELQRG